MPWWDAERGARSRGAAIGRVVLVVVGLALLGWSWRAWPDPIVDFGREVYVPWLLSEGAVLYRDIEYLNGPLSPYLNALAFQLFGVGMTTLFLLNLTLLALLTALLHELLTVASSRLAATAACVTLLALFGFGQYFRIGNYNHLAPYSHEATHGLLLGVAAIACLGVWVRRGGAAWIVAAGLALGSCFLTKAEHFVAAAAAVASGLLLSWWLGARRPSARELGLGTIALITPALGALGLLALAMPLRAALGGVSGTWLHLFTRPVASVGWYELRMGTGDVAGNFAAAWGWFGALVLVLAPAAAWALVLGRASRRKQRWAALGAFAGYAGLLWLLRDRVPWFEAPRLLPVFAGVALLALVAWFWRTRTRAGARDLLRLMLLVYALVLLGKMLLNVRIGHYGFSLALPATAILVVAGVGWVPALLERRGGSGPAFRAAFAAVLLAASIPFLVKANTLFRLKSEHVSGGADRFRAYPLQARVINPLLDEIETRVAPHETLAVLPEGVMINYLARRPSSIRYFTFNPFDLLLVGEGSVRAAFEASPPDAIALVHHSTAEWGKTFFGRDYAVELDAWIRAHYRSAKLVGQPPLRPGTRFGAELLLRDDTTFDGPHENR